MWRNFDCLMIHKLNQMKYKLVYKLLDTKLYKTERGGSVVMHETRIREVLGSNPSADQPD